MTATPTMTPTMTMTGTMTGTMTAPDRFDVVFAALSDPTRRSIVRRLADGEASVLELAEPFPISLPAISRHLKVLEQAGLITKGRDAQFRPCRLNGPALKDASEWMEEYRAHWEASFDRLGDYLKTVTAKPSNKGKPHGRKK